jgi:hypothetical protein
VPGFALTATVSTLVFESRVFGSGAKDDRPAIEVRSGRARDQSHAWSQAHGTAPGGNGKTTGGGTAGQAHALPLDQREIPFHGISGESRSEAAAFRERHARVRIAPLHLSTSSPVAPAWRTVGVRRGEEFHDLEVRLQSLKATRNRLEEFLARAKTIEEVLRIESELTRLGGEIDRIEGRMRFLESKAMFSSITVTLEARAEPVIAVDQPPPPPPPANTLTLPVDWIPAVGLGRLLDLNA